MTPGGDRAARDPRSSVQYLAPTSSPASGSRIIGSAYTHSDFSPIYMFSIAAGSPRSRVQWQRRAASVAPTRAKQSISTRSRPHRPPPRPCPPSQPSHATSTRSDAVRPSDVTSSGNFAPAQSHPQPIKSGSRELITQHPSPTTTPFFAPQHTTKPTHHHRSSINMSDSTYKPSEHDGLKYVSSLPPLLSTVHLPLHLPSHSTSLTPPPPPPFSPPTPSSRPCSRSRFALTGRTEPPTSAPTRSTASAGTTSEPSRPASREERPSRRRVDRTTPSPLREEEEPTSLRSMMDSRYVHSRWVVALCLWCDRPS